jgi:schlafen family protein
MVALRSRRLESLLGVTLDAVTADHVRGLVTAQVQEAFDLDFKQALYGRGDSDKRALAGDVAALANTGGGIIVLGVQEDDQARATDAPGVDLSDIEITRMRQIVASLVVPMPILDILMLPGASTERSQDEAPDSDDEPTAAGARASGPGYFILAVPRSPRAPHAVLINDALRYPVRNGATTRYLSEPEVATAYRNRLAGEQRQAKRIEDIEREAIDRLDTTSLPWIVVSLVPDIPGDLVLNHETFMAFQREMTGTRPALLDCGVSVTRIRVGRRRLLADGETGNGPQAGWISIELHTDGSGVYALVLNDLHERRRNQLPEDQAATLPRLVDDEAITIGIMSGLLQLARHARDRAAAGGDAVIRAQLLPVLKPIGIGHTRFHGVPTSRGGWVWGTLAAAAEVVVSLDDLAEPGAGHIAAAALLADELGQVFGVPEMGQLSHDGRVRRRYWGTWQKGITAWAAQHGIEVIEEALQ